MKHLWSFLAFSKIYFIYVNTHGERRMFRDMQRKTDRHIINDTQPSAAFPFSPSCFHTLYLFMFKCLSPPLRAGPTKRALTAAGLWKR